MKSAGARPKLKPQRAASGHNATIQPKGAARRAVAMEVLKKLRHAFRLAKSQSEIVQKRAPVSNAQMWVLRELEKHPGIRVTELALAMALHQSTISNLIEKLKHRQLVQRKRDNMDARVVHLYLTAAGERVVSTGPSAPRNDLLDTLEHLSANTLNLIDRELAGLLDRTRQ